MKKGEHFLISAADENGKVNVLDETNPKEYQDYEMSKKHIELFNKFKELIHKEIGMKTEYAFILKTNEMADYQFAFYDNKRALYSVENLKNLISKYDAKELKK